ncbi:formyltransferase family protein [Magnetococcales bacterium HHB-1]
MDALTPPLTLLKNSRLWKKDHGQWLLNHTLYRQREDRPTYSNQAHHHAAIRWLNQLCQNYAPNLPQGYSLEKGWLTATPSHLGQFLTLLVQYRDTIPHANEQQRLQQRIDNLYQTLLNQQQQDGSFKKTALDSPEQQQKETLLALQGLLHTQQKNTPEIEQSSKWLLSQYNAQEKTKHPMLLAYTFALLSQSLSESPYKKQCQKLLDHALSDPFQKQTTVLTSEIISTLWYGIQAAEIIQHQTSFNHYQKIARFLVQRFEINRYLSAKLTAKGKNSAAYSHNPSAILLAQLWFHLFMHHQGSIHFLNAALKLLDQIKESQNMQMDNPALDGAISYSDRPLQSKDFCVSDTRATLRWIYLLTQQASIAYQDLTTAPPFWSPPAHIPQTLKKTTIKTKQSLKKPPLRIMLLTHPHSIKAVKMLTQWQQWNFSPTAIILEQHPQPPQHLRLYNFFMHHGLKKTLKRLAGLPQQSTKQKDTPSFENIYRYSEKQTLRLIKTGPLDHPETIQKLKEEKPDLFIHAGAGILRKALLEIPRLGTLNAHMGLLPHYRGMNVTEWAAFHNNPVGCSIHFIDPGIDTGRIILVKPISTEQITSITQLREQVDQLQMTQLGLVIQQIIATGEIPPTQSQTIDEGEQYFRMHPHLKAALEKRVTNGIKID